MKPSLSIHLLLPLLLTLADPTTASYAQNLNYRSPSEHHPGLGIAIHKVVKRSSGDANAAWNPSQLSFTHGVASGDPYPKSVILWTRVGPTTENDRSNVTVSGYVPLYDHSTESYVKVSKAPVCVEWKIGTDKGLKKVADEGKVYTSSDVDYTVKVEAEGLKPFTTYYYQFNVCKSDVKSPIGRTKTTPRPDDKLSKVGIAVFSCANFPFGFFNAYGNPVRKDSVDYVVHLGDYIYEYGNGEYGWGNSLNRIPLPDKQIYSLYDYRKRLATYRTDKDLLESHQQFPWIPVWDDHEVADNTYRDGASEANNTESSFVKDGGVSVDQRKLNAVRAYFEWMPIRQVEMDDNLRIWRSFSIGNLLDLIMLDTRQYDRSITDLYWNTDYINRISNDAGRSLMGARQESWFYNQLSSSAKRGATWRVIGNQILFSHLNVSMTNSKNPFNFDGWDGYQSSRNRTLAHLYQESIPNNVFLAGDSHASWVSDLTWLDNPLPQNTAYNPVTGSGAIGVEFGGSAVSSPSPAGQNVSIATANTVAEWMVKNNPELQWSEFYYRGYYELQVSHTEVQAQYFGLPTVRERNGFEIGLANFTVVAGENRLKRPVGGGLVESGFVKGGKRVVTNGTIDTTDGRWFVWGK